MKKFILGLIIGIMLCTVVLASPISAFTSDIVIRINGTLLDAQAINFEGSTYIPLRAVGEALDKDVVYHVEDNSVDINDKVVKATVSPTPTPTVAPAPKAIIKTVESAPSVEDIKIYTYWGNDFVFAGDVKLQLKEVGLRLVQADYTKMEYTIFNEAGKTLLSGIKINLYTPEGAENSHAYFTVDYYKKNIVPLLK